MLFFISIYLWFFGELLVWLFGPNTNVVNELIQRNHVASFFRIKHSIPHQDVILLQKAANILLFLEWTDEKEKGFFSAKFFEYIGAGRPILGIGPPGGVVDEALKISNAGIMENEPMAIVDKLCFFIKNGFFPHQQKPYIPDFKKLKKYTREYQTRILAQIMEQTIARQN